MLRGIAGVIVGYVVMAAVVVAVFSGAYAVMGADTAYKPNSYEASMTWCVMAVIVGLLAAILGGLVCAVIAKGGQAPLVLALIVLVLGAGMAWYAEGQKETNPPGERTGNVSNLEAMQKSVSPTWMNYANPIIGMAGVLIGSRLRRRNEPRPR